MSLLRFVYSGKLLDSNLNGRQQFLFTFSSHPTIRRCMTVVDVLSESKFSRILVDKFDSGK